MEKYLYNHKQLTIIESDRIIFGKSVNNNTHAIILKGGVWVHTSFAGFRLAGGNVCGLLDPLFENYNYTYNAEDDVTICPIILDKKSYKNIFSKDPKYLRVFLSSYQYQLKQIIGIYDQYSKLCSQAFTKLLIKNNKLLRLNTEFNVNLNELGSIEVFRDEINSNQFSSEDENYLRELNSMDFEALNTLLASSYESASRFLINSKELSDNIYRYTYNLKIIFDKLIDLYAGDSESNLFINFCKLGRKIVDNNGNCERIIAEIDSIIVDVQNFKNVSKEEFDVVLKVDVSKLDSMRNELFNPINMENGVEEIKSDSNDNYESVNNEYDNLTEKLLDFGKYEQSDKTEFINSLNGYRQHQKVRFNKDISRAFIKRFEDDYINLYERVYKQTKKTEMCPDYVKIFLDYGILSEKYIDEEQMAKLSYLLKNNSYNGTRYIYTFREWLDTIYVGKNEPSKNELDLDYTDYIRSIKKSRSLSVSEERTLLDDRDAKVSYEINNFFKSNLRLLFSSNATYCPFVNEIDYIKEISTMITTANEIITSLDKWMSIDFTLFYREKFGNVKHHENNVRFKYKKEVLPNIIVFPILGKKCSMWQEMADRNKNKRARIAVPMYKTGIIDDLMLNALGRYRWEYARSENGSRWNDITYKSLTSEYYDYLMFFKKNKNLSETVKNKLKDKMVSTRNNISEMFVMDYFNYVKYESTGASRLNKESRRILSTYCPYGKDVRKVLENNPMFEDCILKSESKLRNEYKEIYNRVIKLENEGTEVPEEIKNYMKVIGI